MSAIVIGSSRSKWVRHGCFSLAELPHLVRDSCQAPFHPRFISFDETGMSKKPSVQALLSR